MECGDKNCSLGYFTRFTQGLIVLLALKQTLTADWFVGDVEIKI